MAAPKRILAEIEVDVALRYSTSGNPIYGVSQPSLCVIAQGSKEILLGKRRYRYDSYHYLLATAERPVTGRVLKASEEKPFLGLALDADNEPTLSVDFFVDLGYVGHGKPPFQ